MSKVANRPSFLQWADKGVPSLLGNRALGVSRQADHLTETSAHAPQRLRSHMVSLETPKSWDVTVTLALARRQIQFDLFENLRDETS
ncbi:hypothetical protein TNCV_1421981 [Trichonephila clavipes]|nr:hypothetical protein TNCV_1421981 [Trichonephila clavipes]